MRSTGFHLAILSLSDSAVRDFKDLLARLLSAVSRSRQRSASRRFRLDLAQGATAGAAAPSAQGDQRSWSPQVSTHHPDVGFLRLRVLPAMCRGAGCEDG